MRPVLLRTEDFALGSYPCMVLLAAVLAVVALACRGRRRNLDHGELVRAIIPGLVAGWIGGRVLPVLFAQGIAALNWGFFLPWRQAGQSLTFFLLVAVPVALLVLARRRRHCMLDDLDTLAPSLLIGLAVVKVGCLLAGCCAGRVCPPAFGIRYPFGSPPYIQQWRAGTINPPAPLLYVDAGGRERLLGSVNSPSSRKHALLEHARSHNLSASALLDLAAAQRSLPAWPVPVWYSLTAALLWLCAEVCFRRTTSPGLTSGMVLFAYALMRLLFDGFLGHADQEGWGLSLPQLIALPLGIAGAGLMLLHFRRNHSGRPGYS